ncbi:MAG: hypothetical protein ACLS2X_04010 [Coprococcus sp.]
MIIRSKAPLRLGWGGVRTYPAITMAEWCSITIDMYAYCTIEPTEDGD